MAGTGLNASSSDLHARQTAEGVAQNRVPTTLHHGKLRYSRVTVTVDANTGTGVGGAVDNNDEINLIVLPANSRLFLAKSFIKFSATQGASSTVDIGHRAYRNQLGVDVAEDRDSILDGWDATTVLLEAFPTSAGALGVDVDVMQTLLFSSQSSVTLFMRASDSGGTYDGDVGDTYDFLFVYGTD